MKNIKKSTNLPNQRNAWYAYYKNHSWRGVAQIDWAAPYIKKGAKVLELGCGNGKTIKAILQYTKNITAIDFSQKAIDKAKEFVKEDKVKFQRLDISEIDTLNEKFDVIIANYFLHHFTDKDQQLILDKLYNILNKNGYLLIESFSTKDARFGKGYEISKNVFVRNNIVYNYTTKSKTKSLIEKLKFKLIENTQIKRVSAKVVEHFVIRTIAQK